MSWFGQPKTKEHERYYLLAGMGGKRALRRKRKMMLQWALVGGIFASALVALLIYFLHSYR